MDPLYLANEGKRIAVVPGAHVQPTLAALRSHPYGQATTLIEQVVTRDSGTAVLKTPYGSEQILDIGYIAGGIVA